MKEFVATLAAAKEGDRDACNDLLEKMPRLFLRQLQIPHRGYTQVPLSTRVPKLCEVSADAFKLLKKPLSRQISLLL